MKIVSKYNSNRDDLIEYISKHKEYGGILSDLSDTEIKEWAVGRSWDFLWEIYTGIWKGQLDRARLFF